MRVVYRVAAGGPPEVKQEDEGYPTEAPVTMEDAAYVQGVPYRPEAPVTMEDTELDFQISNRIGGLLLFAAAAERDKMHLTADVAAPDAGEARRLATLYWEGELGVVINPSSVSLQVLRLVQPGRSIAPQPPHTPPKIEGTSERPEGEWVGFTPRMQLSKVGRPAVYNEVGLLLGYLTGREFEPCRSYVQTASTPPPREGGATYYRVQWECGELGWTLRAWRWVV